ncbi:DUF2806 domain-containing protein [Slackia isoflavoniconvertens]|uniref:DUF2806 domain-containing protein n=1 Tax=Slackia isoflavoniconvertens TaxID=572010 RepID=UPI003AF1A4DA
MDNSLKNEAKANLQAGGVNIAVDGASFEPTLNLSFNDAGQSGFPSKFIRGVRRAFNPVKVAQQDADIKRLDADSVSEAVATYRAAFPSFNDAQLFMLAYGYSTTAAEADNVLDVLQRAGRISDGSRSDELPLSCVDLDIRGAQSVYDDELRDIWVKLISQEASTGMARSKRTKSTLETMDADDAKCLSDVLSFCVWTKTGPRLTPTPIPVLVKTPEDDSWSYNGGAVSLDAVKALDSLGILSSDEWVSFTLKPNQGVNLASSFCNILLLNNKDVDVKFHLGDCRFLKPGVELAEIIGAPTDERVIKLMRDTLEIEVLSNGFDAPVSG